MVIKTDIKGIKRFVFTPGTDQGKLHLHVTEVKPGRRAHAPHHHKGEEIFWVLSGKGEVVFDKEVYCLTAGEAIQMTGNEPHGIKNTGDTLLRYAVITANS